MGQLHKVDKVDYLITIDVDWASEEDISCVIDLLVRSDVKATWFVTHDSEMTKRLQNTSLFEVGVHPNFDDDSTQGGTPEQIMSNLVDIVPSAVSVRTHRLVQSHNLLSLMAEDFHIKNDVSLFLPGYTGLFPHKLCFPRGHHIIRLPYIWEDSYELLYYPKQNFDLKESRYNVNGLKIFNFHPQIIEKSNLVKTFFKELTELLQSKGTTIKEVGGRYGDDVCCVHRE